MVGIVNTKKYLGIFMKTIYKKYCNDIQNPVLGAFLIHTFASVFFEHKNTYTNLLDIFIFIPLIMVRDVRELIFWFDENNKSHKITKISKLYEKIGYIGKTKDNFAIGTINNTIFKFREYIISSIIFAIEAKLVFINLNGQIVPSKTNLQNKELNEDLRILTNATTILARIYASDYDINEAIKYLEVIL